MDADETKAFKPPADFSHPPGPVTITDWIRLDGKRGEPGVCLLTPDWTIPMQNALLSKFIQQNKRTDIPTFRPGDTIRVHVKIKEGDKERLQAFEGTVIARNN